MFTEPLLRNGLHNPTVPHCRVLDRKGPVRGPVGPLGYGTSRPPDGGKVVSLTRRQPFTPRKILGAHFSYRLSRAQSHSAAGKIRSTEKSRDLIRNGTRDLPACGIVPQPTTLTRASMILTASLCNPSKTIALNSKMSLKAK
jgi:hypothetical protein